MSLLTGEYFEVDSENGFYSHCNGLPDYGLGAPPQKHAKRRFFQGNANWDEDVNTAIAAKITNGDLNNHNGMLAAFLERAGRADFGQFGGEEGDVDVHMNGIER